MHHLGAGKWTGVCGEVCVCRLFGGWGWGGAEKSRWRYSIALQSSKHAELCTDLWTVSETLLWLNTLEILAAPPHTATRRSDFFTVKSCPLHCLMLTKFFVDWHFYAFFFFPSYWMNYDKEVEYTLSELRGCRFEYSVCHMLVCRVSKRHTWTDDDKY